jgi:hypothetical protein
MVIIRADLIRRRGSLPVSTCPPYNVVISAIIATPSDLSPRFTQQRELGRIQHAFRHRMPTQVSHNPRRALRTPIRRIRIQKFRHRCSPLFRPGVIAASNDQTVYRDNSWVNIFLRPVRIIFAAAIDL